jgi:UDP-N-acetylmuramate--alanine ligase
MSAIVRLLLDDGVPVSGSDSRASDTLAALRERGASVHVGHDAGHLGGAVLVVVSTAVRPDNPEVAAASAAGVPVVHRSVALAGLMHGSRVVAVAGTHGKTTTTSMTAVAARAAGLDPSYAIGGDLVLDRVNARRGTDPVFVAEADESDGSFLAYRPTSPSSPTSRPTTSTTTATSTPSTPRSPGSRRGCAPAGCSSSARTTAGPARWCGACRPTGRAW